MTYFSQLWPNNLRIFWKKHIFVFYTGGYFGGNFDKIQIFDIGIILMKEGLFDSQSIAYHSFINEKNFKIYICTTAILVWQLLSLIIKKSKYYCYWSRKVKTVKILVLSLYIPKEILCSVMTISISDLK